MPSAASASLDGLADAKLNESLGHSFDSLLRALRRVWGSRYRLETARGGTRSCISRDDPVVVRSNTVAAAPAGAVPRTGGGRSGVSQRRAGARRARRARRRALERDRAAERADAVLQPDQARAAGGSAPPAPSSVTETRSAPAVCLDLDAHDRGVARAWPRSSASRRRRSTRRPRRAAAGGRSRRTSSSTGTGERRASDFSAGPRPPSARIAGWIPARDLAQLVLRGGEALDDRVSSPSSSPSSGGTVGLRRAQLEAERDEPLLRAVVEVALDLPPRLVGGGHDARARRVEVGGEAGEVVDQDPDRAADDDERDQRDEVDGTVDRQRAERPREDDHARREADDHGEQRRPHAADARHDDDADQQAEEDAAEAEVGAERQQRAVIATGRGDREHPGQRAATAGSARAASPSRGRVEPAASNVAASATGRVGEAPTARP